MTHGSARSRRRLVAMMAGLVLLNSINVSALELRWEDRFTLSDKEKLTQWVHETRSALERLVGELPFNVHAHFYRRDHSREPVPWASTRRGRTQGVDFHVDPAFPFEDYRSDWTAPHEFSHLILPYLGSEDAWFAEGFASYMQYQVMIEMGEISIPEASRLYRQHIEKAHATYDLTDVPFAQASRILRNERKYSVMYWGGAVFFLRADRMLHVRGDSLVRILGDYLRCCHRIRGDQRSLLRQLDSLAGSTLFTSLAHEFETVNGFPALDDLFTADRGTGAAVPNGT